MEILKKYQAVEVLFDEKEYKDRNPNPDINEHYHFFQRRLYDNGKIVWIEGLPSDNGGEFPDYYPYKGRWPEKVYQKYLSNK